MLPNQDALEKIIVQRGPKKRRLMYSELTPKFRIPGFAPICWDISDPRTLQLALAGRLMRKVPEPNLTVLEDFGCFVSKFVSTLPRVSNFSFHTWIDGTNYTQARKDELALVYENLHGGYPDMRYSHKINAFGKLEWYPSKSDFDGAYLKFPRMILSRGDGCKVTLGPPLKEVEKIVFALPEFIKHTPVPERPAKIASLLTYNMRTYESDFTAFESSFVRVVMLVEMILYKHTLSNFPTLVSYLENVLCGKNRISTRHGVKATVTALRMSGEMNTSLGNGFMNLMINRYVNKCNGYDIVGFVEGDDGIFVVPELPTVQQFAELGFSIKIKEVVSPLEASFCGIVTAGIDIIRDPLKFIAGFNYSHSCVTARNESVYMGLLRAKALSTMYETPNCPIVSELAWKALAITAGYAPRFVHDGYHDKPRDIVHLEPPCVSFESRELMSRVFGVEIEVQLLVESMIQEERFDEISSVLMPTAPMIRMYSYYAIEE